MQEFLPRFRGIAHVGISRTATSPGEPKLLFLVGEFPAEADLSNAILAHGGLESAVVEAGVVPCGIVLRLRGEDFDGDGGGTGFGDLVREDLDRELRAFALVGFQAGLGEVRDVAPGAGDEELVKDGGFDVRHGKGWIYER